MLRLQEMVPDWYVEKSRDFQVLCRLYDFTLNGLKYNIDTMQSLTDTRSVKDTVLPLVGDKFGIYDKEAYTNRYLLEALPIASKYKGSLKSINILLNAFLDSMDIFDYAVLFHSRDEESAAEISELLKRKVKPYSLVVIFSSFPSLTNLHILDEYINRVIPSGFIMEYGFGITEEVIDTFKAKEYTFLLYTHKQEIESGELLPYIGYVKGKDDVYSAAFSYAGTDNIKNTKEKITETTDSWIPKYVPVPIPPSTEIIIEAVTYEEGKEINRRRLTPNVTDTYSVVEGEYVYYSYNGTKEFIEETLSDIDVNAVGIATVVGGDE